MSLTKKKASPLMDLKLPYLSKPVHIQSGTPYIENGDIVWGVGQAKTDSIPHEFSGLKLFGEFLRLADATDDQLLAFAKRYGDLGLCVHGAALGHRDRFNARCYKPGLRGGPDESHPVVRLTELARESIEGWRRYIKRANGILTIADKLRQDKRAKERDWEWLWDVGSRNGKIDGEKGSRVQKLYYGGRKVVPGVKGEPEPVSRPRFKAAGKGLSYLLNSCVDNPLAAVVALGRRDTLAAQKEKLAQVVNHWLDECEVGISINWSKSDIEVRLGLSDPLGRGNRLLIAIGVQLLCAVLRQDAFTICAACGAPYFPERRPRAGERHYCQDCGKPAANKFAKRRSRAKGEGA